jgi:hypothetical protein
MPNNLCEFKGTMLIGGLGVIVVYVEAYHLRAWFRRQHQRGNLDGP